MNKWITGLVLAIGCIACKGKDKAEEIEKGSFFNVKSFLQSEAKKIDTLSRTITKIEKTESGSDTSIITKEQFKEYARDFLDIPDISTEEKKKLYDEAKDLDTMLKSVIYTYTTRDPDEEVRRETLMLYPDESGTATLRTIIVDRLKSQGDLTIEKNMTWHIDRRFQVITKTAKETEPEKVSVLIVKWE